MKISEHKVANGSQWTLDGELTIYHATSAKTQLMEHLNKNKAREIEIDLSRIRDCDSAGAQLLLLVKRECMRLGTSVKLVRHSRCVLDIFEIFNIGAYFGDPLVIPGSDKRASKSKRISS